MKLLSLLLLVMFAVGCGGYSSGSGTQPTTPTLTTLMPASATAGGETFVLTVTGTGFASNSIIYWNSVGLTTTFTSAQELAAEIPASDIAKAGSATVFVKNPGTGVYANGATSNMVSFTIQ